MPDERPYAGRCPEAAYRAGLSDEDFWSHVLLRDRPAPEPDGPDDVDPDGTGWQATACPECGEHGPCGYDAQGRPMVHVAPPDE